MALNVITLNVTITKAEETVTAVWNHIIAVWEPVARVWCLLSSTAVHVSESSHLDERFGPDSGAHGQDSAGSSLQEANVTLQLPALHQRARLQEGGQTHGWYSGKQSVGKPEALWAKIKSTGLTGASWKVFRDVTMLKMKRHKRVSFPSSMQPSAGSVLINDFRLTHLNIEAHLAHA